MSRFKTFDSTGLATAGRLYAGDLNAIQDLYADIYNLSQTLGISSVAIGEAGLQLLRYGAGEARLSGHMRADGILRGLGGLFAGAYSTTARDAIALGQRPFTLVIFNTTTNQFEWNAGTDAAPSWQAISAAIADGSITLAKLAANSVDSSKIVDGTIVTADISGTLKPSVSAAAGTEALRALGATAATAAAGNDSRLSDTRTPTDGTVTDAKITAGGLSPSKITGTAVITSDSRLSDARPPTANSVSTGTIQAGAVTPAKLSFFPVTNADAQQREEHGSVSTVGSSFPYTVNFAHAFASPPTVITVADTNAAPICRPVNITASGFQITAAAWFDYSGNSGYVYWHAIGA